MRDPWADLVRPPRTVAGRGSRNCILIEALQLNGPIVLVRGRSVAWADTLATDLRKRGKTVLEVRPSGEPALPKLEEAIGNLRPSGAAAVIAVGGGSAIDFGKALTALLPAPGPVLDYLEVVGKGRILETDPLTFFAVPTTAGTGAEATRNAVIDVPHERRKVSLRDARMMPKLSVLDADLTDGAPWPITLMTGMDAITQLIEPFLSKRATPATDTICRAAIPATVRALRRLSGTECREARNVMLAAAHLSGIALTSAGLGAVHGLAGVIGARTGEAHGAICARLLPFVLEVNRSVGERQGICGDRFREVDAMVAEAFDGVGKSASSVLHEFFETQTSGAPKPEALSTQDISVIAQIARSSSSMKANPVELSGDDLTGILQAAYRRERKGAEDADI